MVVANHKPEPATSSSEPKLPPHFPESCRARSLWSINELAECLTPTPQNCDYVFGQGEHYYCQHPQRQEIVIRTLKIIQGTAQ